MINNSKNWNIAGVIATAVIVLSIPLSWILNINNGAQGKPPVEFTGGKACIECHQKEFRLWKGSDHDKAMSVATDSTVLGNFSDAVFSSGGINTKFYRRDGLFYVFTRGAGGEMKEHQVTHTFGVRPLQQYLIPFENGKYQCLPIAWNSEKKEWFDMASMVYNPDDIKPDNWLYWTNQAQNWNGMCAECHSTNLQKNYDLQTKSYNTTWSDINVNCEACHGPGSEHINWSRLPEMSRPQDVNAGLVMKTSKVSSRQYVESCAPCHARRGSLGPNEHKHQDFLDYADPQLITEPIYYIDGQFRDEDYEYGSFTQSKMYMKDVRCGDCHDPHSLKRKFEGNALCTQCHQADDYDTRNHHMHKSKGEAGNAFYNKRGEKMEVGSGTLCRDCHMPGRYYMGIDRRYDHSMRIPRPDLTLKLGTPNACNNCHDDKTAEWSVQNVNKWYGESRKSHYGTILNEGAKQQAGADEGLLKIINSNLYPEIIRATAIGYLSFYQSAKALETVRRTLNDPDPLLRHTAVLNFTPPDSASLFQFLAPLLNDPVKLVRTEAANRLSSFRRNQFNDIQYRLFTKALEEYRKSQEYVADFPTARYNLGNFYSRNHDMLRAEENYKEAITIDNLFYPAKTNLAMIYYQQGKADLAEKMFRDLVANHPEVSEGYYYLALLYGEQQKLTEAISTLESGISKGAGNTRMLYNLGLLYQMTNQNGKCESTFLKGEAGEPDNFDLLYAIFVFYAKQDNRAKATLYLEKLRNYYPDNQQVKEIYNNFQRQN
ncbi:MAG TPA: multiheme c-type cytochrome [Prolixibacteraceae bacterium]|nr:multiheme c-type cytochrome [Prolixibacteraceae bacterium]